MFLSQDIQVFVQESNYRQVNGHDGQLLSFVRPQFSVIMEMASHFFS